MSEYFQDITPALRHVIGDQGEQLTKTRPINRAMKHLLSCDVGLQCEDFRGFVVVDVEGWRRELSELKGIQVRRAWMDLPITCRKLRLDFEAWKPVARCEVYGVAVYYIPNGWWLVNPWKDNKVVSIEPSMSLSVAYSLDVSSFEPECVYQPWEDVVDNFGLEA